MAVPKPPRTDDRINEPSQSHLIGAVFSLTKGNRPLQKHLLPCSHPSFPCLSSLDITHTQPKLPTHLEHQVHGPFRKELG